MDFLWTGDTRDALEGEYSDISDLSHVTRDSIGIAPFTL